MKARPATGKGGSPRADLDLARARICIAGISATSFSVPFRAPFHTAGGTLTRRDGVILRLVTDMGVTGVGEASPHPALGLAGLREVEDALERIGPAVVGTSLEAPAEASGEHDRGNALARAGAGTIALDDWIDRLRPSLPPALVCALDGAAGDALARACGVSLARILCPRVRARVPVNAVIGAAAPADVAGHAAALRAAGFGCVKLKVGAAPTLAEERERVAAARRALGSDVRLRLDANGAWSAAQAVPVIRALEAYDLDLVEQPIGAGQLEDMRRVQESVGTPLAADEDVTSVAAARRVLEAGAARILVVKPMVVGGLGAGRRIADLAASRGAGVIVTSTIDAGIGTALALHLAAALPENTLACGLATGELLAGDLVEPSLAVRRGMMELPPGPGLGVMLDEDELGRVATGPERSWKRP